MSRFKIILFLFFFRTAYVLSEIVILFAKKNLHDGNVIAFVSRFFNWCCDIFTFNHSEYNASRILRFRTFFQIYFSNRSFCRKTILWKLKSWINFPMTFFLNNYLTETPIISRISKDWSHFFENIYLLTTVISIIWFNNCSKLLLYNYYIVNSL